MNRSYLRRLAHVVGLLLLIALVIPFVVYAVPGVVGADGSYVVLSGSMEPTISPGDVVIVESTDPATISEGDVITYVREGDETPTTHRVIEVTEEGGTLAFRTQGDFNENPDANPVVAPQVQGTVEYVIPYIGYIIQFVNTPVGFVVAVAVPFLLLAISEVLSFFGITLRNRNDTPEEESDSPEEVSTSADDAATPSGNVESMDTNTFTLTKSDLRLSFGILVGTTVYAGWIVTHIQTPWSFAVLFATGMGTILVGGMYILAGSAKAGESPEGAGKKESEISVVSGSISDRSDDRPLVTVDSLSVLRSMADADGGRLVYDTSDDEYFLPLEDAIYHCGSESESEDTTPMRAETAKADSEEQNRSEETLQPPEDDAS